jgi:hypothetical protein
VPLVADEAPREHRSSSVADKAPREHRSSSVAVASTAAVKPAAVPALRESPRAPLHPSRAALLAPASTARAQSVPSVLHVTIDRIDVRSAPPSPTPTPRAGTARPAPSRSLADYLRDSGDASSSRGGPRA